MMSERVGICSYKVSLNKLDLWSPGVFFVFLKMPVAWHWGRFVLTTWVPQKVMKALEMFKQNC